MKRRRKRFTEREVIHTLLLQGATIPEYRTRKAVTLENFHLLEREHLHEFELGGADDPSNARYSFKAEHAKITNGTKATTAGSSKNRLAKASHKNRKVNFVVAKEPTSGETANIEKPELEAEVMLCMSCCTQIDPRLPHKCPEKPARERMEKGAAPMTRQYFWPYRPMESKKTPRKSNARQINEDINSQKEVP